MKMLIAAALMLGSSSAMAAQIMKCTVPSETNAVTLQIDLMDDQSVDFVLVTLTEKAKSSQFFSQMDKGEVANQLKQGYIQLLAMTDHTSQVDGVIVNTGFLAVSQDQSGAFGGFLAANSNIYPLECTK